MEMSLNKLFINRLERPASVFGLSLPLFTEVDSQSQGFSMGLRARTPYGSATQN